MTSCLTKSKASFAYSAGTTVIPQDYASLTDAYDRGCRHGAIALWYSLALSMRAPGRDCEEDRKHLKLMAGLTREN